LSFAEGAVTEKTSGEKGVKIGREKGKREKNQD